MIRETVPGDVDAFYQIYSHPAITEYMEGLYPDVEEERQYVRDYIEKVYTFFGFGVWTVVERESGGNLVRSATFPLSARPRGAKFSEVYI